MSNELVPLKFLDALIIKEMKQNFKMRTYW